MGTGQTIVIALLVVGVLFVTVLLVRPELASRIPGLGDLVYYRADFDVYIQQNLTGPPGAQYIYYNVDVRNLMYRKAALSIGGLGFFSTAGDLEVTVYEGEVRSHFEDAIVVDRVTARWEWGLFGNNTTVPVSVKLGSAGSGKYTLKFQVREYTDWQKIDDGSGSSPLPTYKLVVIEVPTQ